jgi:hypothetical protein
MKEMIMMSTPELMPFMGDTEKPAWRAFTDRNSAFSKVGW